MSSVFDSNGGFSPNPNKCPHVRSIYWEASPANAGWTFRAVSHADKRYAFYCTEREIIDHNGTEIEFIEMMCDKAEVAFSQEAMSRTGTAPYQGTRATATIIDDLGSIIPQNWDRYRYDDRTLVDKEFDGVAYVQLIEMIRDLRLEVSDLEEKVAELEEDVEVNKLLEFDIFKHATGG